MMMAAGVGGAAAQGRSPTTNVRFGVESVYDAISTAGGPATARDGASRFRADFSTRHSTRRARWQIQSGVTADQMWQSSLTGAPAAAVNADYAVVLDRRSRFDLTERLTSAPIDLFTILGSTDPVSSSPLAGSRLDLGSVARSQVAVV